MRSRFTRPSYSATHPAVRDWRLVFLLLVLVSCLTSGIPQAQAADSTAVRALPQLQNDAAANPRKTFRVVIQRVKGNRNADAAVSPVRGAKVRDMANDAFVANVPGAAIKAMSRNPAIKFITYDAPMRKMGMVDPANVDTVYPGTVNAPELWSSLTGAGIGVAVLDTGISSAPDWQDAAGDSRIAYQINFNSNATSTTDGSGHGTHVAGIIAGNSWNRSTSGLTGKYMGIAPEAKLINVKVSDDQGMSYASDVVDAIEWVIANRTTHNIRVMNLSLVSSVAESYKTSILDAAVEKAWFSGILVTVAAGNFGPDTVKYPPANDPFVITVGASDPLGTTLRSDDGMAPWSSYGITQDGFSKPEVVAPGRSMVSVLSSSTCTIAMQFPTWVTDTDYLRMSGTSMASPVVAGSAALAFQAHPEWTNDQVKWLLLNTSTLLGDATPLPGQGAGEIDAAALAHYSSTPELANQGLTVSDQLVGPNGTTTYTSTSTASWSTASWSTASWSTASWSTASWSTASWSTVSWSMDMTEPVVH
jgi:serine protease AprX